MNPISILKKSVCMVLVLVGTHAIAQQDISLYTLGNISQRTYVNPAYMPSSNFSLGLPGISSVNLRVVNSGFNIGKALEAQASGSINADDILGTLAEKNLIAANVGVDLLSVGFKVKNAYLSFNATTKVAYDLTYPKDLFRLVLLGNGSEELLGRRVSLDGLATNIQTYQEFGFGFNLPVNKSIRLGARVKYLVGLAALNTYKSQLGFTTDADDYALTIDGKYAVQTSGNELYEDFRAGDGLDKDAYKELGKKLAKNYGVGVDLGAEIFVTNRLSVNVSVLDIGKINWAYGVKSFESDTINFRFDGIDARRIVNNNERAELIQDFADTLRDFLNYSESNSSFTTNLNTRFIAGLNYELFNKNQIGVLAQSEIINKTLRPAISIYYTAQLRNWISATVNYSYLNRSFLNLGAGFTIKAGPIQAYILTDNVMSYLSLETARGVQLRTGINLVFGGKEKRKLYIPDVETAP